MSTFVKYHHVERLGHEEVEGLLDGEVVVQEKMDGANLTVQSDGEGGLLVASRNRVIAKGEEVLDGFGGAVDWVLGHDGIKGFLRHHPHLVLRGEWSRRHSISYAKEHANKFWVFDVQDDVGAFVPYDEYVPHLRDWGIDFIPVMARLSRPSIEEVSELAAGPSQWGAEHREGVVVKRYDFRNKWGRTVWGKVVSADFKVKHKGAMGANRFDAVEQHFAALLTDEFLVKELLKIKSGLNEGEVWSVELMPRILGMVWYTIFHEELWGFVKKKRVKVFDFGKAKKLCDVRVREFALGVFNGVVEL